MAIEGHVLIILIKDELELTFQLYGIKKPRDRHVNYPCGLGPVSLILQAATSQDAKGDNPMARRLHANQLDL